MAWSDAPTVIKQLLGYFGPKQHEMRVLRKFIGRWDAVRPYVKFDGKRQKNHLAVMDKLRKELR